LLYVSLFRWNCNYRPGWDASLTAESQHPKVGPSSKEVITKFGSVMVPREGTVDRTRLRQSNALTAHREVKGVGIFSGSNNGQLQQTLIPGPLRKGFEVQTHQALLDTSAAPRLESYRNHHPPPSARKEVPAICSGTSPSAFQNSPCAWQPQNPNSVTYGVHRRW